MRHRLNELALEAVFLQFVDQCVVLGDRFIEMRALAEQLAVVAALEHLRVFAADVVVFRLELFRLFVRGDRAGEIEAFAVLAAEEVVLQDHAENALRGRVVRLHRDGAFDLGARRLAHAAAEIRASDLDVMARFLRMKIGEASEL